MNNVGNSGFAVPVTVIYCTYMYLSQGRSFSNSISTSLQNHCHGPQDAVVDLLSERRRKAKPLDLGTDVQLRPLNT